MGCVRIPVNLNKNKMLLHSLSQFVSHSFIFNQKEEGHTQREKTDSQTNNKKKFAFVRFVSLICFGLAPHKSKRQPQAPPIFSVFFYHFLFSFLFTYFFSPLFSDIYGLKGWSFFLGLVDHVQQNTLVFFIRKKAPHFFSCLLKKK
jgi:hypothetical protein